MSRAAALFTVALVVVVGGALAVFLTPNVTDQINRQSAVSAVEHAGVPAGTPIGPPGMAPLPLTTATPSATPNPGATDPQGSS